MRHVSKIIVALYFFSSEAAVIALLEALNVKPLVMVIISLAHMLLFIGAASLYYFEYVMADLKHRDALYNFIRNTPTDKLIPNSRETENALRVHGEREKEFYQAREETVH